MSSHSGPHRFLPWLSALLLLALGLRLLALEVQPLWWDEGYSLYFATETPARLLDLTSLDIHPPLYYLLLQGWMALLGIGAIQARLLSVFLGVLALPLAWQVARCFVGKRAAGATVLLLALSPFHIYYSQEVRMYALVALLALLAVAAWQRRAWAMLGLALLAGLLTHYYFALLALALALLIARDFQRGRYARRGPLMALAIAVVGYLPWVLYAAPRLLTYVSGKLVIESDEPMTPLSFLPRHLAAWSIGHLSPDAGWLSWAALLSVALLLFALSRRQRFPLPLLLLWAVPTVSVFFIGLRAPFVDPRIERQLLFVLPFFLMLVSQGLSMVWERWPRVGLPSLLLLLGFSLCSLGDFYTVPRYPGEDYRPVLARVGAEQGPGDGWLALYPWQIGYLRAYLPARHPTPLEVPRTWAEDHGAMTGALATLWAEHPRLWFPAYQVKGRLFEEELSQALTATGAGAWNEWEGNTRLYLFGRAPQMPPLQPVGTVEQVGEMRAALGGTQSPSGIGILPVFFEAAEAATGIGVSLQLVGRGSVWGEWDGPLEAGIGRAGLPVDPGTPPGDYTVHLTLYREETGQPLERFENGERRTPAASLGTLTVTHPAGTLSGSALQRRAEQSQDEILGETIHFLGATVPQGEWHQGDSVPLTLFWQPQEAPGAELHVFIQAIDSEGAVRAARDIPPVEGTFPTSQWQAGDLVRDPHPLTLPPDMPPGTYRLVAGLYEPATGTRLLTSAGRDVLELGTLQVYERPRQLSEPTIGVANNVHFGERVVLARVAIADTLSPGTPLEVTLVWRSTQTGGTPLRVFVQLYYQETQLVVSDHLLYPPATAWIDGEWIVDEHTLLLPAELEAGEYRLIVGLYDPATGSRLATPKGEWSTIGSWNLE
ncbi:MAG: glycosyltransferase family 39 protein [Ardenticatenales bacterium]|nr:glycosyltransferase family 39 protein [Ardenticatenales bacterium]